MKVTSHLEQPQNYVNHVGEPADDGKPAQVLINPGKNTITDDQHKTCEAVPLYVQHKERGFIVEGDEKRKEEKPPQDPPADAPTQEQLEETARANLAVDPYTDPVPLSVDGVTTEEPLSEVVEAAFTSSELSAIEWNALTAEQRTEWIELELDARSDAYHAEYEARSNLVYGDTPDPVEITEGVTAPRAEVVEAAFTKANMSAAKWNILAKDDIEQRIKAEVDRRKEDAEAASQLAAAQALANPSSPPPPPVAKKGGK